MNLKKLGFQILILSFISVFILNTVAKINNISTQNTSFAAVSMLIFLIQFTTSILCFLLHKKVKNKKSNFDGHAYLTICLTFIIAICSLILFIKYKLKFRDFCILLINILMYVVLSFYYIKKSNKTVRIEKNPDKLEEKIFDNEDEITIEEKEFLDNEDEICVDEKLIFEKQVEIKTKKKYLLILIITFGIIGIFSKFITSNFSFLDNIISSIKIIVALFFILLFINDLFKFKEKVFWFYDINIKNVIFSWIISIVIVIIVFSIFIMAINTLHTDEYWKLKGSLLF